MQKEVFKKIPKRLRAAVSAKIRKLMHEGKSQKQAIAMALNMAREKKLGSRGGYRRNPDVRAIVIDELKLLLKHHPNWAQKDAVAYLLNRTVRDTPKWHILEAMHDRLKNTAKNPINDKDLAPVIAFLLYLRNFPTWSENVPDRILTILIDEQLYVVDDGITRKGEKFLDDACVDVDDESVPDDRE